MLYYAVLCCTMLYYAVLSVLCCTMQHYAVLCCTISTLLYYAVLCCIMLYYAVLCCTMLYYSVLCCIMLYYAVQCCTMLYYAKLCCTMLYYALLWCSMLYYALIGRTMLYYTVLCWPDEGLLLVGRPRVLLPKVLGASKQTAVLTAEHAAVGTVFERAEGAVLDAVVVVLGQDVADVVLLHLPAVVVVVVAID